MSNQEIIDLLLTWGRHFHWGNTLEEVMRYLRDSDGPTRSFVDVAKQYASTLAARWEQEGDNG